MKKPLFIQIKMNMQNISSLVLIINESSLFSTSLNFKNGSKFNKKCYLSSRTWYGGKTSDSNINRAGDCNFSSYREFFVNFHHLQGKETSKSNFLLHFIAFYCWLYNRICDNLLQHYGMYKLIKFKFLII